MISHFLGWAMLKAAKVVSPCARNLLTCTRTDTCVKKRRAVSSWPLPTDPDAALLPGGVGPGRCCAKVMTWRHGITLPQVLSGLPPDARRTLQGKLIRTVSKGFRRRRYALSSSAQFCCASSTHGLWDLTGLIAMHGTHWPTETELNNFQALKHIKTKSLSPGTRRNSEQQDSQTSALLEPMPYQEIPSPEAKKARQNLEREWKKALALEAEDANLASESFGKVATGIVEWFPLTGADRKIKDDDDDAEDFNEHLQSYKEGDISSCIKGCDSLLRNAPDLSYRLKVRVWCLQAVALVSPLSPCGHEIRSKVEPAIFALRCAYLGEADAGRTMEDERRQLRPLTPAPAPPPAPAATALKAPKAPPAAPAPRGEICPTCHQRVEKLKTHKKKCPQRQVPCKLCKTHCSFESLEKHMRDDCENRDVNCDKCDAPMKYKDLNYHQSCQCECGLVRCQNDGCRWSGFRRSEADHRLKCLYLKVTCTHCLMELIQKDMPGHQCDRVDMSAPCSVCLESFSRLERKEIPPVMMLINNRRSCAHPHCLKCAQNWFQRNAEQGLAPCPVCRAEYDSTTPFPDYLLQRETKSRRRGRSGPILRPPLPRQEEMKPGNQFFVSPLDVRFTHDSISECFAPYVKDGEQLTDKERLKVLSSAKELLDGDEEPKALEMLDVVWYQNNLYVAGTFNRRLCMYRLLALFATERFGLIKVQVKSQDDLRGKFNKSLTTKCKGQVVKIRTQNNNSEEFQVGESREELHWPEAVEALGGGDLEEMSPSQSETEEETPSPMQTPVQSKQSPSDLDRVIAAMAEFHSMPLDQVRGVMRQLSEARGDGNQQKPRLIRREPWPWRSVGCWG
eukprot:s2040_g14.t1